MTIVKTQYIQNPGKVFTFTARLGSRDYQCRVEWNWFAERLYIVIVSPSGEILSNRPLVSSPLPSEGSRNVINLAVGPSFTAGYIAYREDIKQFEVSDI